MSDIFPVFLLFSGIAGILIYAIHKSDKRHDDRMTILRTEGNDKSFTLESIKGLQAKMEHLQREFVKLEKSTDTHIKQAIGAVMTASECIEHFKSLKSAIKLDVDLLKQRLENVEKPKISEPLLPVFPDPLKLELTYTPKLMTNKKPRGIRK